MKSFLESKTILLNAVVAGVASFPVVTDWIAANPSFSAFVLSTVNILLRSVTKEAITVKIFGKDF